MVSVGSLFSGCGGLDLGFELAGFETKWFAETDKWCNKILEKHWPEVPRYGDVNGLGELERTDVLIGGFPCQPVSQAGKKLAEEDPRWLWPGFLRTIRLLQPNIVVVENVPGLRKRGFDRVLGDLAEGGYNAQWFSLRSSDVGAPHRRERVFIIANSIVRREHETNEDNKQFQQLSSINTSSSNPSSVRTGGISGEALREQEQDRWPEEGNSNTLVLSYETPTISSTNSHKEFLHGKLDGGERGWTESTISTSTDSATSGLQRSEPEERSDLSAGRAHAHAYSRRQQGIGESDAQRQDECWNNSDRLAGEEQDWGKYEDAIRRWETIFEPAPKPLTDAGRLSPNFVEWMMGYPQDWTEGVSRSQRLKMLGNSVQVQSAYEVAKIVKSLAEF